jgi:hypothetical protein
LHRLSFPAGRRPSSTCIISLIARRAAGRLTGTFHHIAFGVETDEQLVSQKALYEELGYTDASR